MKRIKGIKRIKIRSMIPAIVAALLATGLSSCAPVTDAVQDEWQENARLDEDVSEDELYKRALEEDILIVYTVSTRTTKTKEAFEDKYPGLCVEVRDLRSPDLIEAVRNDYDQNRSVCDVVICNDNSGAFKEKLIDTGITVPYISQRIRPLMKPGHLDGSVSFLDEAEILFYDSSKYDSPPVSNIWELTEEQYKGRIYLPNPLRSFSTYAFVASTSDHEDEFRRSYEDRYGQPPEGDPAPAELFWTRLSQNAVFTNSSDEVLEALHTGSADLGFMVSSKLRFCDMGYDIEPVYRLEPFSGCRTSYAVMMAYGSRNVNTAKLFIDFLLGGYDGNGDGYKPFITMGTWSARSDVPDGNDVPLSEIDLMMPDQDYLITNRSVTEEFWTKLLTEHGR